MNGSRRLALFILGMLLAFEVAVLFYAWPRLPDMVAQHFGLRGEPNGWASKTGFYALVAVLDVVLVASLYALPMATMGSAGRRPGLRLNVPNRDYWLAPERAEHTRERMLRTTLGFANVTMAFVVWVVYVVVDVNLHPPPRLPDVVGVVLIGYLMFTLVWVVRLLASFRRP